MDQLLNVLSPVLVVGIRVDDHICSQSEARIKATYKGLCQSQVAAEVNNMISSGLTCSFRGVICAAVINHQDLHAVKPIDGFGEL